MRPVFSTQFLSGLKDLNRAGGMENVDIQRGSSDGHLSAAGVNPLGRCNTGAEIGGY